MADVVGEAGEHSMSECLKRLRRLFFLAIVPSYALLFAIGLATASRSLWGLPVLAIAAWLNYLAFRKVDVIGREMICYARGATGEHRVGEALKGLPGGYRVFNNVTHPSLAGNCDHVVVGPTGVFLIETKNWRGRVAVGPGDVLLENGKAFPEQEKAMARVANNAEVLKRMIVPLAGGADFWMQAVIVFPVAYVERGRDRSPRIDLKELADLERYLTHPRKRVLAPTSVAAIANALSLLQQAQKTPAGATASAPRPTAPGADAPRPGLPANPPPG